MILRAPLIGLLAAVLVACQSAAPHSTAGQPGEVVFVDAAGNRMLVDVVHESAKLPSASEFGGEQFVDVDTLDQQAEQRSRDRFYPIPQPGGERGIVSARALGAEPAGSVALAEPARQMLAELKACSHRPVIEHLLVREAPAQHVDLLFPAYGDALAPPRRYAGHALPVPTGAVAVRLWAIVQGATAPDVVALLVDREGRVSAVVNNIATESIPENLFRYGRVGTVIPLPRATVSGERLVVLEGHWARKMLPVECHPAASPGLAVGGRVTLEFLMGK